MNYRELVNHLYSFIPKTNMKAFPGEYGMQRVRLLLKLLGNPQEKTRVIHIAGTSGKGSTALMISALLVGHGKKVGLHVKPHIYDLRERFQIDNKLISEERFIKYGEVVLSKVKQVNEAGFGQLTYFEVLISLAYYTFSQEQVDYSVIETGVGGEFDGSNVVVNPDKIAVITSIGYDHTSILGKTLPEIAKHKAGIMQNGNDALVLYQRETAAVFTDVAAKRGAQLELVRSGSVCINRRLKKGCMYFDFLYRHRTIENVLLSLPGEFQVENAAMALVAVHHALKKQGIELVEEVVKSVLDSLRFPGRFDTIQLGGKNLILDGAHNEQKMNAFLTSLAHAVPQKKYTFLLAFKKGKEIRRMLDLIIPYAKKIYLTDFFNNQTDFVNISEDTHVLAAMLEKRGMHDYEIVYSAPRVMHTLVKTVTDTVLVCTGSLYLMSEIYQNIAPHNGLKED